VKYLAIRGELERYVLKKSTELDTQADPSARLVALVADKATDEQKDNLEQIKAQAATIVGRWAEAPAAAVAIEARPEMTEEEKVASIKRGRDLFYGTVANCVKCHGDSALGDGQLTDYDDWAGEFIGKGPDQAQLKAEFVSVGMPAPRNIRPRNLRQGVYRGGLRPIDIYWRIRNGIEGTPMPAATMKPEGQPNAKGLTPAEIWDIVNYVQSLPYESISNPNEATRVALERGRM
jgi:mono/diheme cytochrome c family protein